MISYNPKDWFTLIFQFHKSDTFRILLPTMLLLGLFTGGLVYVELHNQITFKSSTVFHQILGFVLSMLLVFRINSAYDRWWEGRKQWGSLVNSSRNFVAKVNAILPEENKREKLLLKNLVNTFVFTLKDHLRNNINYDDIVSYDGFDKETFSGKKHKPSYVVGLILKELENLHKKNIISGEKLLFLNNEIQSFLDITGACERIKNTPIPYSYSLFLKKIIFIYVITMPFPFSIDFRYWSVPMVIFIFYAFASLELVSEEIEEPFGDDPNDLPTQEIAEKIRVSLDEIVPD